MKKLTYTALNLLFLVGGIFSVAGCSDKPEEIIESPVLPKTTFAPEPINSFTPQRVADLSLIVVALEKYKLDHRNYPISSNYKVRWDRLVDKSNDINQDWIEGLAPTYINDLPRDPRNNRNPRHQYIYKSDGAHYKLIALRPDDCEFVKAKAPQMIDPRRGCIAYGYWTSHAKNW